MTYCTPKRLEKGHEKTRLLVLCDHCKEHFVFVGVPSHTTHCPLCEKAFFNACSFCKLRGSDCHKMCGFDDSKMVLNEKHLFAQNELTLEES